MSEERILLPFSGKETFTIDAKCRLVIPSKIKNRIMQRNEKINDIWFVPSTRNENPYISCYDFAGLPKKMNVDGAFVQYATPDTQWRILLPLFERTYARLIGEVVVAASPDMSHFEIWKKEYFNQSYGKNNQTSVDGKQL